MSESTGGYFCLPAGVCSHDHDLITWTNLDLPCPLCSVLADLRKVSAQLLEAEIQIQFDKECGERQLDE